MLTILKISLIAITVAFLASCDQKHSSKSPPIYSIQPVKQDDGWPERWWEPRHKQKMLDAKELEIDLLMLGDSITQGWENQGQAVWQQFYQNRKAFNLGFNGDRTEHVLWRLQHGAVDNMSPKLVVLMIGTNNTGHRMDPAAHTAMGISAIINELRERLPDAKILLLGIFPRNASPFNEMRKRNDEINQTISTFEDKKHVYYLNINDVFLDENQILHEDIMPDLLHPNQSGYKRWAEAMDPTVRELMR
jgi:lysophospholipase L1-like esterase